MASLLVAPHVKSGKLNVLAAPDVVERLVNIGAYAIGGMKPAEIEAMLKSDYERWGQVIRRAGLKVE